MKQLAWGAKVSLQFRQAVVAMAARLGHDPNWDMACMAFETGETFNPAVHNAAGSGAVGLIQFMPQTAFALGTTPEELAKMTDVHQLFYVERYFGGYKNKLNSLADVYGAILWPAMIGKPDDYVVFDSADAKHPKTYLQNKGLDFNKDGKITKAEVVAKVQATLDRGFYRQNVF